MRKLILALVVPLLAVLGSTSVAFAKAEVTFWQHPGTHPLATSYQAVMNPDVRRQELLKLGAPARMIDQIMQATDTPGTMRPLVDGECFQHQLFEGGRIASGICVKFGSAPYDRRAERWTIVDEATGTKYEITHPYVCHNLSLNVIPPAPPPTRTRCFIASFNYQSNAHVMAAGNLQTAGALAASGVWKGSSDEAYLNENTAFAFVTVHLDFADEAEFLSFINDECTGVRDETGFHHVIEWDPNLCERSNEHWPNPATIDALTLARGVTLPYVKLCGGFRFPCASGVCELSMSLRFARAFVACVDVPKYRINLPGHDRRDWADADNFDLVSQDLIAGSLARGKREKGDIYLTAVNGERMYLTGSASYTLPGTY